KASCSCWMPRLSSRSPPCTCHSVCRWASTATGRRPP
ncbi:LOW QUALITY PROTEIN: dioxygenase, partial [Mycobacterium tuberculosis T46]